MNVNHLAILLYGVLTLVFAFIFAHTVGSNLAMVLIVLATAMTYTFQTLQEFTSSRFVLILWAAVVALLVAALFFAWEASS